MGTLIHLWIPILLSGVFVFVASSLIHMVFKWHNSEYRKLPNEDEVRAALRKENPAPGQYVVPHCMDMKEMGKPEMQAKYAEGPIAMISLKANGMPKMGGSLLLWFFFILAVSYFAASVAGFAVARGAAANYRNVFRIVATVSFMGYAFGSVPNAIWMGRPWRAAIKEMFDGLIYALLTAGTFGWLWPK